MHNMTRANIALITTRSTKGENFQHALVVDKMVEAISLSENTSNNSFVFPLYLYQADSASKVEKAGDDHRPDEVRAENIDSDFRRWLDEKYSNHFSPEEIMGYIYAVIYANAYRQSFVEFLRRDFPRIPFPETKKDFDALSQLGQALVEAHLLRKLKPGKLGVYHGTGGHEVEAPRYSSQEEAIWISKTRCFKPVPGPVWNFHIGGYQVLDKYLKSRKGRKLTLDEADHVTAVANVLAFTIEQMKAIDKAYGAAFPS